MSGTRTTAATWYRIDIEPLQELGAWGNIAEHLCSSEVCFNSLYPQKMSKVSEGQAAIADLNGKMLKERTLTVNEARPRSEDRSNRSYGGRRGGGYGGGRQRRY